jgi:putative transposase
VPPAKLTKNIIRFHNQIWQFEKHNNTIYVVIPTLKKKNRYERVYLPLKPSDHYEEIINTHSKFGAGQVDVDKETFTTSITVNTNPTSYTPQTFIGVDLGLNNLATLAATDSEGNVLKVKLWRGKEINHIRRRFDNYRREVSRIGRLDLVRQTRGREKNWMKNVNHNISREIVNIASEFEKPVIVMENLHRFTNFKWNFHQLRQMTAYKAELRGVKVELVDPKNTSLTCNKCGSVDRRNRRGISFKCVSCGYMVNADVNAAVNIAASCC